MAEGINVSPGESIFFCRPCKEYGNQLPTVGYCVTCAEHLCDTCYKSHTLPRPMRNHVLQDINEISKRAFNAKQQKYVNYRCSIHPNAELTTYCRSHGRLCCRKCADISHQTCESLTPLSQIIENVEESEDFKQFLSKLNSLGKQSESNLVLTAANVGRIEAIHNRCVNDFASTMCNIKDKHESNNRMAQSVNGAVSKQVSTWKNEVKLHRDNRNKSSLFFLMKTVEREVQLMEENVKQVVSENKIETYKFAPVNEGSVIGQIVRPPFEIRTITMKHEKDTKTCGVRSIIILDNEKLAILDCYNRSIKIINYSKGTIDAVVKIQDEPWTMTVTDNNELFVKINDQRTILHFPSPVRNLNGYKLIPLDNTIGSTIGYYNNTGSTIDYYNNALKVTFTNPLRVVELGRDGKLKRTIVKDCADLKDDLCAQMLTSPRGSVVNRNTGSVIYTTDSSLVEIKDDGKARLIVKCKDLSEPRGIVQDVDGSFLVCSWYRKSVMRVTDSGIVSEVITGLTFSPHALALDKTNGVVYVGGDYDKIHVYQL